MVAIHVPCILCSVQVFGKLMVIEVVVGSGTLLCNVHPSIDLVCVCVWPDILLDRQTDRLICIPWRFNKRVFDAIVHNKFKEGF